MIKCAVLGSPISHSLSPRLHSAAYELLGINATYVAIEMPESEFPDFFLAARPNGFTGFSLTMPLKERLNTEGIEVDPVARRINSVNTLYWQDEKWCGTSTDYVGFQRIFSGLDYSSVCVLGGGATARAAIAALDGSVPSISVALRNPAKFPGLQPVALSSSMYLENFETNLSNFDLVISTLPAGASDSLASEINPLQGTLFDVLYNPWPTPLATAWHLGGGKVINGFDLLVEQALDQVMLMTDQTFDLPTMRNAMNKAIEVERGKAAF